MSKKDTAKSTTGEVSTAFSSDVIQKPMLSEESGRHTSSKQICNTAMVQDIVRDQADNILLKHNKVLEHSKVVDDIETSEEQTQPTTEPTPTKNEEIERQNYEEPSALVIGISLIKPTPVSQEPEIEDTIDEPPESQIPIIQPSVSEKRSEWLNEDLNSCGLPRSESRSSRVRSAVRKLFCCGKPEPTSEKNISITAIQSRCALESKASIGPFLKTTVPYCRPSGILICLPKKSNKVERIGDLTIKPSGIYVSFKRSLPRMTETLHIENNNPNQNDAVTNCDKLYKNIQGAFGNLQRKVKKLFI